MNKIKEDDWIGRLETMWENWRGQCYLLLGAGLAVGLLAGYLFL